MRGAHTAAIQLAAASAGRKITAFHFLRRQPPHAQQPGSAARLPAPLLPGGREGSGAEGGARLLGFLLATLYVARRTASSFFSCSQAENPRCYWRESCQAFSGIDPARLWLAGGQKTKYFLLLQRGKEI